MANIFSPIQVKDINFKNRIVMAPMVLFDLTCEKGVMGKKLREHYLERADKGIGLLISQVLSITADREIAGGAGAYSEEHIDYLHEIAVACHKNETKFFAQLGLAGFSFYDNSSDDINKLTMEDLTKIRDEFIRAAEICKKAGLDGIELHGAHTFFLNMMASPLSNKREDIYGRDLGGRLHLVKEITDGIKKFAGDDFIISYRMGWNDDLDMDVKTTQALEKIGIDMLHVSTGIPQNRKLLLPADFEYSDTVYTGCHVRKYVNIPVITVNEIKTLSRGNYLLENNCCDFVAYGRPFLADKNFALNTSLC
jgi:2,4-dienoyl-CoA reductase-like NADH-dependent reductase (Old Yellow Enzyme family)